MLVILLLAMLLGLPLAGAALAGHDLTAYLEFPPRTPPTGWRHEGFSWPAFVAFAVFVFAFVGPLVVRAAGARRRRAEALAEALGHFPWWGWAGLALTSITWVLAWTRLAGMAPLQPFTFSPLWLGYILVANAMLERRTGRSPLTDRPRRYALLFAASAGFWWFFEYLNRFVRNWNYVGVEEFTALEYGVSATLPFATVRRGVRATRARGASAPIVDRAFARWRPLRVGRPRPIAVATLVASAAALTLLGVLPRLLFPLVWVAPLLLIVSLQTLRGRPHVFSPLAHGDWRGVASAAAAALVCGFFWEMWNIGSLAKWEYDIPYVHRFLIFEMPLLGWAGYLPFGLECAAIGDPVLNARATDPCGAAATGPATRAG